jgi:nucleoside-diphosphate-sugar epimerase
MKKVLLTGASGFIGRYTIPILLGKGIEVHAVFYPLPIASEKHRNLIWHKCNLLDSKKQSELMKKIRPDYLLHLAWYTIPGSYWDSTENIRWLQASLGLILNFFQNKGKRAVAAGSCAEYDWNFGHCHEEKTPLRPSTLYGICKKNLYETIEYFSRQRKFSFAWGRIFSTYGPYEHTKRLIPSLIISLLKRKPFACTHGRQIRDFLYVQDVAEAFVALLDSKIDGPVNIASGRSIALKTLINYIARQLGHPELISFGKIIASPEEPLSLTAELTRITEEVGWKPKHGLEEGLALTINWWKDFLKNKNKQ